MKSPRWQRPLVLGLSSCFGLGYLPRAPGTWGTLGAIPLWWLCAGWPLGAFAGGVAGLCVLAVVVAHFAEREYGRHDEGRIVIDEVCGLMVAAIGVPFTWTTVLAAFVLFRFFDILKPWPIRWLDRRVPGGFGVVLDDLVAGAFAGVLLHLARLLHGGWW